jgi:DNA helicase TIP49 (TBP-interacting protein)
MLRDEIRTMQQLKPALESRVLGQPHAVEAIVQRMRTARAGLDDPRKPKGVFLLTGPSGVGKTETALALADLLYGGERKLVTINKRVPGTAQRGRPERLATRLRRLWRRWGADRGRAAQPLWRGAA